LATCHFFPFLASAQLSVLWDRTLGGGNYEELNALVPITDGIIAAGSSRSFPHAGNPADLSWNIHLYELSLLGDVRWSRTYGGDQDDRLWELLPTSDGGYICGGYAYSGASGDKTKPSQGDMDVWVLKLDASGDLEWENSFGGLYRDELFAIREIPGGGYLLGCHSWSDASTDKTANSRGGQDFWIIRLDAQGNKVWDETIGGDNYDQIHDLEWAPDGNVYLSGGTFSTPGSGEVGNQPAGGGLDFWIMKFNPNSRQILWQNRFGGSEEEFAYALTLSGNRIFLGGRSSSPQGSNGKTSAFYGGPGDYWLLELDGGGQKIREWSFGGSGLDDLYFVIEIDGGKLLLGGTSDSGTSGNKTSDLRGGYDYWFVCLDELGNTLWQQSIAGTGNDALTKLALLPDGSILAGGHSDSNAGFEKSENNLGLNDFWVVCLRTDSIPEQENIPQNWYVPNIFSPNDDGINDYFTFYGDESIAQVKSFTVADRWGEICFQRENLPINNDLAGWNGTFRGKKAPIGVYAWYAVVAFSDGSEKILEGDVSLIR
ncbi:MAG: gliding motility-associated C-terminal domain-containing protein, partial [Saprospiraceae bacterium]|nr:gliding motility-associated C-terminal domain-containing protein [Saprospiraceae bacterium]